MGDKPDFPELEHNVTGGEALDPPVSSIDIHPLPPLPTLPPVSDIFKALECNEAPPYSAENVWPTLPLHYERMHQVPTFQDRSNEHDSLPSTMWPNWHKQFEIESSFTDASQMRLPSEQQVEKIRKEINEFALEPEPKLVELMKSNRVLSMGEIHGSSNPGRALGTELMEKLRGAGATHLAVEIPDTANMKEILDRLNKNGELATSDLSSIGLGDTSYVDLLMAAHKAGMQVVPVDAPDLLRFCMNPELPSFPDASPDPKRNAFMAGKISEILEQSNENKVVFWAGFAHVEDHHELNDNHPPAVELLRNRYSRVVSVGEAGIDDAHASFEDDVLGYLTNDIER
jgi:hypothetical protein